MDLLITPTYVNKKILLIQQIQYDDQMQLSVVTQNHYDVPPKGKFGSFPYSLQSFSWRKLHFVMLWLSCSGVEITSSVINYPKHTNFQSFLNETVCTNCLMLTTNANLSTTSLRPGYHTTIRPRVANIWYPNPQGPKTPNSKGCPNAWYFAPHFH